MAEHGSIVVQPPLPYPTQEGQPHKSRCDPGHGIILGYSLLFGRIPPLNTLPSSFPPFLPSFLLPPSLPISFIQITLPQPILLNSLLLLIPRLCFFFFPTLLPTAHHTFPMSYTMYNEEKDTDLEYPCYSQTVRTLTPDLSREIQVCLAAFASPVM